MTRYLIAVIGESGQPTGYPPHMPEGWTQDMPFTPTGDVGQAWRLNGQEHAEEVASVILVCG